MVVVVVCVCVLEMMVPVLCMCVRGVHTLEREQKSLHNEHRRVGQIQNMARTRKKPG